jgi:lipoyl(octanoyl) transferase
VDIRLLIDPPKSGPWNMAVDEALLLDAVENGNATLRFYQWNEPTLSLGYFQPYADRHQHAASQNCSVVRRQSGGGAILHDRELTYSLVLPPGHPLGRNAPQLYDAVHKAFITALAGLGLQDSSGPTLKCRGDQAASSPREEPFLCFQRQSAGDVILVSPDNFPTTRDPSRKILGSAQRRHRGAILQHGSLLLETSASAPELAGLSDLTGPLPTVPELISAVCAELNATRMLRLVAYELSSELQFKTAEIANNKYGSPTWTNRR